MSVEVLDLSKSFNGQRAVDSLSFETGKGRILGFLGPNGAGKSTTMKMLTTFISPDSGTARVAGFDVRTQGIEVRRNVGYLPEHNPLYLEMYVKEYLHFMADLSGLGKLGTQRVEEMITRTGLTPEKRKRIGQLSKGYRQRVGLAQALLHNPAVLILDEPTSGLDPNQVLEIRQLIKEFGSDRTVILSTHIMQEVEAMCDEILILHKGKKVVHDRTRAVREHYGVGNGLYLRFKIPVSLVALNQVRGISSVNKLNELEYELFAQDVDGLQEALFTFAVASGNMILEQNRIQQSLEDVFRKLTSSES